MVQWLRTWFLNVEMKSLNPHIFNLGYFSYLNDLIKEPSLQKLLDHLTKLLGLA